MNVCDLMDAAKSRQQIASDFALSKRIGVSQASVWAWRSGKAYPKPEHTTRLAELAGIDPKNVVLDILAQAEKDPEAKRVFEAIQKCVTATAAALVLTALPVKSHANTIKWQLNNNIHYAQLWMMRVFAALRRFPSWITRTCHRSGAVGGLMNTDDWCHQVVINSRPIA